MFRECPFLISKTAAAAIITVILVFAGACSRSHDAALKRGEEYLTKRQFNEALMEFRAAAEIDSGSAQAHWGMARAYENLGNFVATLEELRKTVELDDKNLDAKVRLGNYFLLVNPPMITDAEKMLAETLKKDANFIEAHLLKASILSQQGKSEDEIRAVLDGAVKLDPARVDTHIGVSRYFQKIGKVADAEASLKKAIEVGAANPRGFIEYGRFLVYADRAPEAEAQFQKAISVAPNDYETYEAIAQYYQGEKQFDKAEKYLKDLINNQQNAPEARMKLAAFYAEIGRDDDAIAVLTTVVVDIPEYARAHYKLAELFIDKKDTDRALEQVNQLLAQNDSDVDALLLRARVRLMDSSPDEALKDLEQILKRQPTNRDALYYTAQARLQVGDTEQAKAFLGDLDKYHPAFKRARLLKIEASFADDDAITAHQQANDLFNWAKVATPSVETSATEIRELRFRAQSYRGLANLRLRNFDESAKDLQEVLNNSPKSAGAMVNLAQVYLAKKDFAAATDLFTKANAEEPQNFDAIAGLTSIFVKTKNTGAAHALLDRSIMQPTFKNKMKAALHFLKSEVFGSENKSEEAKAAIKRSIELDELYFPAYAAFAAILAEQGNTAEAIAQYTQIVEKKPNASVYTLLGMLHDANADTTSAEAAYRKALELSPNSSIAANNLAWLIADTNGNLDEALTLSQNSVKRNPNVADYYDTIGYIYLKKGIYGAAAQQFKKAISVDQDNAKGSGRGVNPAFHLRLGLALRGNGDKTGARAELESSLREAGALTPKEIQDAKTALGAL